MNRSHIQELMRGVPARLARRWPAAPGAVAALLFVASVALGAGALVPLAIEVGDGHEVAATVGEETGGTTDSTDPTASSAGEEDGVEPGEADGTEADEPGSEPGAEEPADEPSAEEPRTEGPGADEPRTEEPRAEEPRTEEPRAEEPRAEEPREEPTREPERTPERRVEIARLSLSLARRECGVLIDWTRYGGDGFSSYRVVRSTDELARWPLGRADVLVGTFENRNRTAMEDCRAPHGKRLFYRVFAVRHTHAGWRIVGVSAVRSIVLPREVEPEPTPRPEPGDEPDATPAPEPDPTPAPEPEPDPTVEPGPGDGEPDADAPPADGGGEH
jgi:hypothetical protein